MNDGNIRHRVVLRTAIAGWLVFLAWIALGIRFPASPLFYLQPLWAAAGVLALGLREKIRGETPTGLALWLGLVFVWPYLAVLRLRGRPLSLSPPG